MIALLAAEESTVKLYDNATAPNPRRVRIYLAEKGISVPVEQVDIGRAESPAPVSRQESVRRLAGARARRRHAHRRVDRDLRYFEEQNPKPSLFGNGPKDRAEIEMWQRRMELGLFALVSGSFQHTHDFFKGRIKQVPEWGAICKENALSRMAWLDGQLASRKFVAGDEYSVADITALCAIDFGRATNIRIARSRRT